MLMMRALCLIQVLAVATQVVKCQAQEDLDMDVGPKYTAADDASWAIYSNKLSTLLGEHKQVMYDKYVADCQEAVDTSKNRRRQNCTNDENFRLRMNREQPLSVYNYTKVGYKKIRAPKELFELIKKFYEANRHRDEIEWGSINTYHNMWSVPPTIIHLNQGRYPGGGASLQTEIWNVAKPLLEEWSGQELSPVSLYGIRLYHNQSILAPHVDRFPLVISAIINVDQDVDETWPLEVYGHDGKATNISMLPGDMVLYESHSVVHGRPFPLSGKYYANIFMHFEPIGSLDASIESTYDPAVDLPPYLVAGSKWEAEWKLQNPKGWKEESMDARQAARKGDVTLLRKVAKIDKSAFTEPDDNGWTPFHEAVRVGSKEAVLIILNSGHNINKLTKTGVTPLNIAREFLEKDHEVTKLLVEMGAVDKSPGRNQAAKANKKEAEL